MSNKLGTYYKELPPWAKGVVGVGGTLVVILIGVKLWGFIELQIKKANSQAEADQAGEDLSYLMSHGINPSFPNSQYEAWANQLVQAFNGCGTDVSTVMNVFNSLVNEADLLKLIQTYGVREYDKCFSGAYILGGGTNNISLSAALSDELSQTDINQLNTILLNKGMKYKF